MICEVCNRQLDNDYAYIQLVTVMDGKISKRLKTKHICCPDCLPRLKRVVSDIKLERKLPGRAGLILDDAKIYALRQAGWSLDKIADEMGCSRDAITKHLEDYEKRKGGKDADY